MKLFNDSITRHFIQFSLEEDMRMFYDRRHNLNGRRKTSVKETMNKDRRWCIAIFCSFSSENGFPHWGNLILDDWIYQIQNEKTS